MSRDTQRLAAPAVFCVDSRRRYPLPASPPVRTSVDRYVERYQLDYPVDYADEIDRYNQLRDRVDSLPTAGYGRLCEPRSFLRSMPSSRVLDHNDLRRRIEARRQSPQYVGSEEAVYVQRTVLADSCPVELTSDYSELYEPNVPLNDKRERERKRRKRKRRRSTSKNDEDDWKNRDCAEPRDTIAALKALASYDTPLDIRSTQATVTALHPQSSRHRKSRRRKSRRRLNSYDRNVRVDLDRATSESSALLSSSVNEWNLPGYYPNYPASGHDSSAETYASSHSENDKKVAIHNGSVLSKRSGCSESVHSRQSHHSAARLAYDDDDVESGELKSGTCTPVSSVEDAHETCRRSRSASAQSANCSEDLKKDRPLGSTDALFCSGASRNSADEFKCRDYSLRTSQERRIGREPSTDDCVTSRTRGDGDQLKAVLSSVAEPPIKSGSIGEEALPSDSNKTSGTVQAVNCSKDEKYSKQQLLLPADCGVEKTSDFHERFVVLNHTCIVQQ
jgi:hypothetical protein